MTLTEQDMKHCAQVTATEKGHSMRWRLELPTLCLKKFSQKHAAVVDKRSPQEVEISTILRADKEHNLLMEKKPKSGN